VIFAHSDAMDVVVRHGEAKEPGGSRSRWIRDRFTPEELQTMIDYYQAGTTAREVAEEYNVSLRSIKRLLRQRGVHRRKVTYPTLLATGLTGLAQTRR
jgi:helix-turn-helix resolvase-like protein